MGNKKPIKQNIKKQKDDSSEEEHVEQKKNIKQKNKNTKQQKKVESSEESEQGTFEEENKAIVSKDFYEKIIKYLKTDNLIREEAKEYKEKMSTLKEQKEDLEIFILRYMTEVDEDIVDMAGNGKLEKKESIRKSCINKDMIKDAVYEQLKKENVIESDERLRELAELTYSAIEGKREITKKTYLKRTILKPKKGGVA